jgi:hypothetical protein
MQSNATLLMLCGVETEEELPSVWAALANAGKGDRAVLERALHETARLCNEISYTPSATVRLNKDIVKLCLHALNDSSLDEGVQPFALTVAGSRSIASTNLQAIEAQPTTYEYLDDGRSPSPTRRPYARNFLLPCQEPTLR